MEICFKNAWQKLLLLSVGAFFVANTSVSAQSGPPNGPQTFYVSKNGNNSDGRTWATAWKDFDQIKWSDVTARQFNSVEIDGGANRMVYRKPLKVPVVSGYAPLQITVSRAAGHNGQVVLAVPDNMTAIEIGSGTAYINGSKRSGLYVYGGRIGVSFMQSFGPGPGGVGNIEISHCREAGVVMANSSLRQVSVHDCPTNVLVKNSSGANLTKCWIYNSTYARHADGIKVEGTGVEGPGQYTAYLNSCVIGPGLRDGISCASANGPQIVDCLFINATRKNIASINSRMFNVTSFMTRLNPDRQAHTCLKLQALPRQYSSSSEIRRSVFFGGLVDVPLTTPNYPPGSPLPFPLLVESSIQYGTTGNTTALGPMINPGFAYNVGALHNLTPIHALIRADFSFQADSPGLGIGTTVTSVQKLLNSFN